MEPTNPKEPTSECRGRVAALLAFTGEGVMGALVEYCGGGKMPQAADDDQIELGLALEEAIYATTRRDSEDMTYQDRVLTLAHALRHNGVALRERIDEGEVTVEQLVQGSGQDLLQGTPMDRTRRQIEAHEDRFRSMLQEKFEELEKSAINSHLSEGLLKCSRCQSTQVVWEQKQTRSADEGMTIFAECLKCGKKFRMS